MRKVGEALRQSDLFEGAEGAAIETLAAKANSVQRANGQAIFEAGDPSDALFVVMSGRIRVFRTSEDDEEVTLALIDPGGLLGEIAVIDGGARTASAAAVGRTELARISQEAFRRFLEAHPKIAFTILKVVCARLRTTNEQVDTLAFLGLEARLARLIVSLARSYGAPRSDGGVLIDLKLGQRELGAFIAISRESVSKQMALWRAEGLIEKEEGRLLVRDLDELTERAQLGV